VCSKPITNLKRIAFGSCGKQNKQQYILNEIAKTNPDLMIYLGDNIYGDTENMRVLREKYGMLSCKKEFRNLLQTCSVIATWDDHDYGCDDSGIEYPKKAESKQIFMEFWNEPAVSERRKHEGIYTSYYYGDSAHRVQVILLDLRTFRTPLIGRDGHYQMNMDTTATMMGPAQWAWLREELRKPAQIRIIGSSTQFATDHNGWETWGNYPLEQKKMFDLIKDTRANGVVFISGDVHYAELSMQKKDGQYPIYDMTASGITQVHSPASVNQYRIGPPINTRNFGMIDIDWAQADPTILFRGFDWQGKERIIKAVKLSELKF
jgi:alkaline phosphatase D